MSGTAIACAVTAKGVSHHGKLLAHQREALKQLHEGPRRVLAQFAAARGTGRTPPYHFSACDCVTCRTGR